MSKDNTIALLIEPRELMGGIYRYVEDNWQNYKAILTHDENTLKLPNAVAYEFGGCWITEPKIYEKTKLVSLLVSNQNLTEGHQLRHIVMRDLNGYADVYGRSINPFDDKMVPLKDYAFSITIENISRDNFFTEKLIDCFATGTIPIYWGMPNIGKYFNTDGMLIFRNTGELYSILKRIGNNPEYWHSLYLSKMPAIIDNFSRCQKYFAPEDSIYKALNGKVLV
jgi:hypothetical protein